MDTSSFQPEGMIEGESSEDTALLEEMAQEVRFYLGSFQWCPTISRVLLAYGIGGVVAVFWVEFAQPIAGTDTALWVVTGDLPPAYMVVDEIGTPRVALEKYCSLMAEWIDAVRADGPTSDVFPVQAVASEENAVRLASRIRFLRENVIPNIGQQAHPS